MTSRNLAAAAFTAAALAAASVVLPSCNCFNVKAGTIKVDTNCGQGGATTSATVPFAQAPGGFARSQIDRYFPAELQSLAGKIACEDLFKDDLEGFCAPLGVGGEAQPVDPANATDLRVLMCNGEMYAIGGGGGSLYLCTADQALVNGQIWFLQCQRFTSDPNNPTGTCQAVAEFDEQTIPGT